MPATIPPITPDEARDIALAGLAHLYRLIGKKGRFVYAHEAGDISAVHEGYNLLRHCGTLWFMVRTVNVLGLTPGPAELAALAAAYGYIGARLEAPPWAAEGRPSLGLVSNGAVKLGGLGLALLALTEARKLNILAAGLEAALPLGVAETATRMRTYALDEIEGDDFRHKRDIATGAVLPFRSDYYTGEAIFGLFVSGAPEAELNRVTAGLMARRYGWKEQSHWMAYAACEAVERGAVPEALGRDYLTGLMEAILADPKYRLRRDSTPIACRSEAITRVLLLDRSRKGLLDQGLVTRLTDHAAENLDIQLGWYDKGQFWKGDASRKVQIDYIQHNATAFLHWAMLGG